MPVKTVIIPAGGLGTRLLPATKCTPKEMLPVYDRPVIQFALDEAVAAGATRILLVVGPGKTALRDYLQPDEDLARHLQDKGKHALHEVLESTGVGPGIEVEIVVQDSPRGLGDAVLCCARYLERTPFGVILPDDLIFGDPCLLQMGRAYTGGHMVAAQTVAPRQVSQYGIFRITGSAIRGPIRASGMVEKPSVAEAPSRIAAVGRYILDPVVLTRLSMTLPGAGGEVQLTDAIAEDVDTKGLTAFLFDGERFDCGCHDGLLSASIVRERQLRRGNAMAAVG